MELRIGDRVELRKQQDVADLSGGDGHQAPLRGLRPRADAPPEQVREGHQENSDGGGVKVKPKTVRIIACVIIGLLVFSMVLSIVAPIFL